MTAHAPKLWLLAYDIADVVRLRRVHGYIKKHGMAVQYSVFGLWASPRGLQDVMDDLSVLIHPARDDVRAYHIPMRCRVWLLGDNDFPQGVVLHGSQVTRLISRRHGPATAAVHSQETGRLRGVRRQ